MKRLASFLIACSFLMGTSAWGQSELDEITVVDDELERNIPMEPVEPAKPAADAPPKVNSVKFENAEPFSRVASVQIDEMPKLGRFMLTTGLALNPTDAFFNNVGAQLGMTYFINSLFGIHVAGYKMFSAKGSNTKDLENQQAAEVRNLAAPNTILFLGLETYPMYGKAAANNRDIIPFDVFFKVGVGQVSDEASTGATAVGVGMGFLFATGRSTSIKLDGTFFSYKTTSINNDPIEQQNLFVNLSYGWMFPEPQYR